MLFSRWRIRNLFDIESFMTLFASIPRNIILVFALFDSRLFFLESVLCSTNTPVRNSPELHTVMNCGGVTL